MHDSGFSVSVDVDVDLSLSELGLFCSWALWYILYIERLFSIAMAFVWAIGF